MRQNEIVLHAQFVKIHCSIVQNVARTVEQREINAITHCPKTLEMASE